MTRKRYDDRDTAFGQWLRTQHQQRLGSHTFSAQNLDYIWHNYRENWFILIEEKTHGGMRNQWAKKAQDDTHGVVTQLLEVASGAEVDTMRGRRPCEFRGYYYLVFEETSPRDGRIWVNGQEINEVDLIELLTTGEL